MNIKIITKQTTEHEIEITIPFFRKKVTSGCIFEYIAMLSERYVHKAFSSDLTQSASIRPLSMEDGDVIKALNEWEEISEEEFLAEHDRILSSLSLKPTLVYAADPNDLKNVNI